MSTRQSKENGDPKPIVDMKLHIRTVASELMTEKGIKETSLKDIAKKAGISQGTLYYHYSAKEDIIYDIADYNLTQITDGLLAWIDADNTDISPEQILKEVFEKILGAETRGKLHLYLLSDAVTSNNALTEKFKERYNDWRKMLEYGLNKVLSKDENRDSLSCLILAALDGLIIQNIFCSESIPVEEIVKLILKTQLK